MRVVGLAGLASSLLALALIGCDQATSPPPPPSAGHEFVLSFAGFTETVAPILTRQGCDATGDCHGGGIRGTLELSPPDAKDLAFDFAQVSLQVTPHDPASSPILTEPLIESAGGTPHSHEPFDSTDHPDYQAILGWIEAGAYR